MSAATTPASSDARAPQITRDRTSRPISSVPNQCAADGALRMALQLVASGSYGATTGAKIATVTTTTITTTPAAAPPRRMSRRNGCERGDTRGASTGEERASSRGAIVRQPLMHAYLRVDDHVRDVRQQVEQDVRRRRKQ